MPCSVGSAVGNAFDLDAFVASLPADVQIGAIVAGDWRVDDIHWWRDDGIQIRLGRNVGDALKIVVMARDESRRVYARTASFDVVHLTERGESPLRTDLNAKLALDRIVKAITAADAPGRWHFEQLAPTPERNVPEEQVQFNLSIETPCGSRCGFCSVSRTTTTRITTDDAYHARLLEELERGRARGAAALRINGVEPLAYDRVIEVAAHARAVGFQEVDVLTTAQRLADRDFLVALTDTLPAARSIAIPIYGSTAERHEAVTQSAGSFGRVLRALENLASLPDGSWQVRVTTVVMQQTLDDVGATATMLRDRFGLLLLPHLPYPNSGGRLDPYSEIAPRFTDVVRTLHALDPVLAVIEAPPCVLARHERETGIPSLTQIVPVQRIASGRFYRSSHYLQSGGAGLVHVAPALPCPRASECSLAEVCTREIYRAYVERHGWDELAPPS